MIESEYLSWSLRFFWGFFYEPEVRLSIERLLRRTLVRSVILLNNTFPLNEIITLNYFPDMEMDIRSQKKKAFERKILNSVFNPSDYFFVDSESPDFMGKKTSTNEQLGVEVTQYFRAEQVLG